MSARASRPAGGHVDPLAAGTLTDDEYGLLDRAALESLLRSQYGGRPSVAARQGADPVADTVAGTVAHAPRDGREMLLCCAWCGALGSAAPAPQNHSDRTGETRSETRSGLSWSALPVDGEADSGTLTHRRCGGPIIAYDTNARSRRRTVPLPARPDRQPAAITAPRWQTTTHADQVYDDMRTLGYFDDRGRLKMQSRIGAIRRKNRQAAERAGGTDRTGDHIKASAAIGHVLDRADTAAVIHQLADEYRAATTKAERWAILARRPLPPVNAGERALHKEQLDEHQIAGRPVTADPTDWTAPGRIDADDESGADARPPAQPGTLLDFPEVPDEMLGWLPSDERTVIARTFDGYTLQEIADELGYPLGRVWRIKQRAIRYLQKAA